MCPLCGVLTDEQVCGRDGMETVKAPDRPLARVGGLIGDRYRVTGRIGGGGFGEVFRAFHVGTHENVAIKLLRAEVQEQATATERFTSEARLCASLRHPNTVRVFDFGVTPEQDLYLAMELLEGRPLEDLLSGGRSLQPRRAAHVAIQALKSLHEAHGKGVVHRDLKPDNIFVCDIFGEKDFVKVIDFGIAKVMEEQRATTLTQTGVIIGTPHYMSPEQIQGLELDGRSDLYALGCVLYRMLTGRLPFAGSTSLATIMQHLNAPPVAPRSLAPALDGELERIVMSALEKKPDQRFADAQDMRERLERWLGQQRPDPLSDVRPSSLGGPDAAPAVRRSADDMADIASAATVHHEAPQPALTDETLSAVSPLAIIADAVDEAEAERIVTGQTETVDSGEIEAGRRESQRMTAPDPTQHDTLNAVGAATAADTDLERASPATAETERTPTVDAPAVGVAQAPAARWVEPPQMAPAPPPEATTGSALVSKPPAAWKAAALFAVVAGALSWALWTSGQLGKSEVPPRPPAEAETAVLPLDDAVSAPDTTPDRGATSDAGQPEVVGRDGGRDSGAPLDTSAQSGPPQDVYPAHDAEGGLRDGGAPPQAGTDPCRARKYGRNWCRSCREAAALSPGSTGDCRCRKALGRTGGDYRCRCVVEGNYPKGSAEWCKCNPKHLLCSG